MRNIASGVRPLAAGTCLAAAALALCSGCRMNSKISALPVTPPANASRAGEPSEWARGRALIEQHAFATLAPEHQRIVLAAGAGPAGLTTGSGACDDAPWDALPRLGAEEYEVVRRIATPELWARMRPVHQHALVDLMVRRAAGEEVPAMCFAPETDVELVEAFNAAVWGRLGVRFQQAQRWTSTATNGGGLSQGTRTTLRYSFVPDGTIVPTLTNGVTQPSNLFAFLDGIYGTPAVWQPIYAGVFERWGQLCGLDYVLETNDDGADLNGSNGGVVGVRGDVRLAGTGLDGPSAVLAFNYFPNNGDMVIDTADTFYNSTGSNSLRLRNVLAHEHGHGLGMAHVCPANQTKLMEPFVSTAYDGPQFDDILNGQRHYGDRNEPNDTVATATPLANPSANFQTLSNVSCDDRTDVDVYRVTIGSTGLFIATARPVGSSYIQGPQTSPCDATGTSTYVPTEANSLAIEILDADGVTVLGSASAAVGSAAGASAVVLTPRTAYIRVQPGSAGAIQPYELDFRLAPPPIVLLSLPAGAPALLDSRAATAFPVRVQTIGEVILPGSATLRYRATPTSAFTSAPLTAVGGEMYEASIPPLPCGATPQFFVQVQGQVLGTQSFPIGASATTGANTLTAQVGSISIAVDDDFETAAGWVGGVAGDTATSGIWTRGDPNGTTAQPEDDLSDDGTQCWFTGQAAAGAQAGTNDVDGGFSTLLSPVIDLSALTSPRLSYWRWYSNNAGASPNADTFRVDISSDGGTNWTNLETVGPSGTGTSGNWIRSEFDLAGRVPINSTFRIRFVADDADPGSLVEAAVDEVRIESFVCVNACRGDFNNDGTLSVQDLFDFLAAFFADNLAADYEADGVITVQDLFTFLGAWFTPCG